MLLGDSVLAAAQPGVVAQLFEVLQLVRSRHRISTN
jgi:hypothetical protein